MCGGGSKGQSQSTTTQTPTALPEYNYLLGRANQVGSQPYQAYGGQLVADLTPMQQQGIQQMGSVYGAAQPFINQASQYAASGAAPIQGSAIQNYLNPYQQQVTSATMNQLENLQQANNTQAMGGTLGSGGLFNDRAGVMQGQLANQEAIANAQTLGQLNTQNYSQALQAAQADRAAQQQAAYQFGNLGQEQQGTLLQGAQATLQGGGLQQQQQQNLLNSLYGQWQQQQAFPYQQLSWLAGLGTGIGSQMGGTSNTVQTPAQPNPFNLYGGLGLAGLGLFSGNQNQPPTQPTGQATGGRIQGFQGGGSPYADDQDTGPQSAAGSNLPFGSGPPSGPASRPAASPFASATGYIPQGTNMPTSPWGIKVPGAGGQQQQQQNKSPQQWSQLFSQAAKGMENLYKKASSPSSSAGKTTQDQENQATDKTLGQQDSEEPPGERTAEPDSPGGGGDPEASADPTGNAAPIQTADADPSAFTYTDTGTPGAFADAGTLGDSSLTDTAMADTAADTAVADAGADALGSGVATTAVADVAPEAMDLLPLMLVKRGGFIRGFQGGGAPDDYPDAPTPADAGTLGAVEPPGGAMMPVPQPPPEGGGPMMPVPEPPDRGIYMPVPMAPLDTADVPNRPEVSSKIPREGLGALPPSDARAEATGAIPPSGQRTLGNAVPAEMPGHSDKWRNALLTAGLSLMASRSPWFGSALGEAGLQGLSAYAGTEQSEKLERLTEQKRQDALQKIADARTDALRKQAEVERHNRAEEGKPAAGGFGWRMNPDGTMSAVTGGPHDLEVLKAEAAAKRNALGVFTDDTVKLMADSIRAGNTSVLMNLGSGPAKAENIARVWNQISEDMKAEGKTGSDIAAAKANFNAQARAAQSQAVRSANIESNIEEFNQTAPLALDASKQYARGDLVPWNKLHNMVAGNVSDPKLKTLVVATQGVITAYTQAMARAGVATVHGAESAEKLLAPVDGPEAYAAALKQMENEMHAAQRAPEIVQQRILARISGRPEPAATPSPTGGGTTGGGGAAAPASGGLPDRARALLKEGINTPFNNGQVWTLRNGQPLQVQ